MPAVEMEAHSGSFPMNIPAIPNSRNKKNYKIKVKLGQRLNGNDREGVNEHMAQSFCCLSLCLSESGAQ